MADQIPAPEITQAMEGLLKEVRKHAFPAKEKTLFSIGGIIGRLENPTTKWLGFFMDPDAGHDLGPLFLRAFFACMGNDCSTVAFDRVKVWPQDQTEDRKAIDLLISDSRWVLLIENKIGAPVNNPLGLYEMHAKHHFPCHKIHLAILSRDGQRSAAFPQWNPVSYHDYCNALRSNFTKTIFDRPISKWQAFAREFIVHLENTLSNPSMTMTPEQKALVEANLRQIRDLKKLSEYYTEDLKRELSETLQKGVMATEFQFDEAPDVALICKKNIGQSSLELWFQTPAHAQSASKGDFIIDAWVGNLTPAQVQRATELFTRLSYEKGGAWVGERHFIDRTEAVNALGKLAAQLFDLLGNDLPGFPPPEAAV